jgi:hypothetical protein
MMWPIFALISVLGATAMPLLHQQLRPDSAGMLFWLRIISFVVMLPVVLYLGLPTNIWFYVGTLGISIWMSLCDVLYFNAVKKHGAGVVSRILPGAALGTFFLWFIFDPLLIEKYVAQPTHSLILLGVMGFGVFCATHLTRDHVSRGAIRDIWFVIVSAVIGPIIVKLVLGLAPKDVAPLAFVMTQGLIVALLYLGYQMRTHRIPHGVFFGRYTLICGAVIAVASMISIAAKSYAFIYVDNPAYVSLVLFTAPVFISLIERALGHPDHSNKWAGFGLVMASATIGLLQIK